MEKLPYQPPLDQVPPQAASAPGPRNRWRGGLPGLAGSMVMLRELGSVDAPALLAALTSEQVSRFVSPPPATVDGFEQFIAWTHRQRTEGQYICFAIVPAGSEAAVGIVQVRSLESAFGTAEWGFALAEPFWGTGIFVDAARLVVDFAFDVLGAHRLEARAALSNGRGNGALRKLGARQEGVLRRSFFRHGEYLDQALWTILDNEWRQAKAVWGPRVIVH
jgi:ribosomal-protein-alanine N-acetyltransferase